MNKKAIIGIFLLFLSPFFLFAGPTFDTRDESEIPVVEFDPPDEVPFAKWEEPKAAIVEVRNEMPRLNTSQPVYHLLILDRTYCALNSDISDVNNISVLYKYRHGRNGYLIAIYSSSSKGPVFVQMPARSRVIMDMVSIQKSTIKEYVNSSAFRKYVTNRTVLANMLRVL